MPTVNSTEQHKLTVWWAVINARSQPHRIQSGPARLHVSFGLLRSGPVRSSPTVNSTEAEAFSPRDGNGQRVTTDTEYYYPRLVRKKGKQPSVFLCLHPHGAPGAAAGHPVADARQGGQRRVAGRHGEAPRRRRVPGGRRRRLHAPRRRRRQVRAAARHAAHRRTEPWPRRRRRVVLVERRPSRSPRSARAAAAAAREDAPARPASACGSPSPSPSRCLSGSGSKGPASSRAGQVGRPGRARHSVAQAPGRGDAARRAAGQGRRRGALPRRAHRARRRHSQGLGPRLLQQLRPVPVRARTRNPLDSYGAPSPRLLGFSMHSLGWRLRSRVSHPFCCVRRYSEAVNVVGFLYSVFQFVALAELMRRNTHLIPHPKRGLFDFTMDQVCACCLVSSLPLALRRLVYGRANGCPPGYDVTPRKRNW
jgi:hypothetical protein